METLTAYMKKTLYKKDSTGRTREWNIEVTDLGDKASILITAGLLNGKLVPQETFVTEGKNQGKANETTYLTQALSEAESKVNAQIRDGYVDNLHHLKESTVKGSGAVACMKAKTYDPTKKASSSNDLKGYKLEGKTVGVQRKYDGIRRITRVTSNGAYMYTRGGDLSKTLPHIEKQLVERFNQVKHLLDNIDEIWIDGEAYSHVLSFNKINGITRKGASSIDEIADANMIEYHIYDTVLNVPYVEREKILKHFAHNQVKVVNTEWVQATEDLLKHKLEEFIEAGYEGLMIRVNSIGYEPNKRSASLLKYKSFEDAEFECVGIEEGIEKGKAAKLICKVDRVCFDRDGNEIKTFKPTLVGKDTELMWALQHPEEFIGKKVTVNFMGRSEYGVPRHCRVKDVRYDI